MAVTISRAADVCLALMAEMPETLPLSGVSGGVAGNDVCGNGRIGRGAAREAPVENVVKGRSSTDELGLESGVMGSEGLCTENKSGLVAVRVRRSEESKGSGAGLAVTQSGDHPREGGHFALGVSKMPLCSARERGGVVVEVCGALRLRDCYDARISERDVSPIPNGATTVGGAETRFAIR